MRNKEKYLENCMKYFQGGMDIASACDRAIAVDYLGEEFINGLGGNAPEVVHFVRIIHNYINMKEKVKEL